MCGSCYILKHWFSPSQTFTALQKPSLLHFQEVLLCFAAPFSLVGDLGKVWEMKSLRSVVFLGCSVAGCYIPPLVCGQKFWLTKKQSRPSAPSFNFLCVVLHTFHLKHALISNTLKKSVLCRFFHTFVFLAYLLFSVILLTNVILLL